MINMASMTYMAHKAFSGVKTVCKYGTAPAAACFFRERLFNAAEALVMPLDTYCRMRYPRHSNIRLDPKARPALWGRLTNNCQNFWKNFSSSISEKLGRGGGR